MEYIITRIDYNHVKAEVEGYYPLKGTYEGFFKDLRSYINRYAFVKNLTYKNHAIHMEKRDPFYGYFYTDSYVLDGLLENDARFMEYLNAFLAEYETIKEKRRNEIEEEKQQKKFYTIALRTAKQTFKRYCETGELEKISDPKVATQVIKLFKDQNVMVYTDIYESLDGYVSTRAQIDFETPEIRKMNVATGVGVIATTALFVTSLVTMNAAILLTSAATGFASHRVNKKKRELNEEEAKKILAKLAYIYETLYGEEINQVAEVEPKLVKERTKSQSK